MGLLSLFFIPQSDYLQTEDALLCHPLINFEVKFYLRPFLWSDLGSFKTNSITLLGFGSKQRQLLSTLVAEPGRRQINNITRKTDFLGCCFSQQEQFLEISNDKGEGICASNPLAVCWRFIWLAPCLRTTECKEEEVKKGNMKSLTHGLFILQPLSITAPSNTDCPSMAIYQ